MRVYFLSIILFNVFRPKYCDILPLPVCDMEIAETIPNDLTYDSDAPMLPSISSVWFDLINASKNLIRLTSFYWTMLGEDICNKTYFPSSATGERVFNSLLEKSKTVRLEIVQNGTEETNDLKILKKNENVAIYYINFRKFNQQGVQHAKVWISDDNRAFIGSPNMDWRSVSEIKELGVHIVNCKEIVSDINKFWLTLQFLSNSSTGIPSKWPDYLIPVYNDTNPLTVFINGVLSNIYTATSPQSFNPPYRAYDLNAIIKTILKAKRFVYVSVMDFYPISEYGQKTYWPDIENSLKTVAIGRNISVKLLISWWVHTSKEMLVYLKSLKYLSKNKDVDIQVKMFIIPAFSEYQKHVPFSRVSHSKYMVTDNTAYIGTSNWSKDYFQNTGGISLVSEEFNPDPRNMRSIRTQLERVFLTDWNSIYAHDLY